MIVVGTVAARPIVRLGLGAAITAEPSWRVGWSASTVADFLDAIESHACAVVVVDTEEVDDEREQRIAPLIQRGFAVVTVGDDQAGDLAAGASRSVDAAAAPADLRAAIIDAFAERPGADSFCVSTLTTRQLEVLVLIGGGLANKQIASTLGVSISTVKRHVEQLMDRTGRRTRAALAALAADLGELRPETLSVLNRDPARI